MADVSATLRAWSATPASNNPSGGTVIGAGLDDNLRQIQATVRQFLASQGTNMASASTLDLSTADGNYVKVTGTTAITALGTEGAGISYLLEFTGTLKLTHNGTSLILLGGADIQVQAGDLALMMSEGSGNWRMAGFSRAMDQSANVASATTTVLDTAGGEYVVVTGTTTITAITLAQGRKRFVEFSGALTLTNGASLILPGGANIVTAAGDTALFIGEAAGVVRCQFFVKASGAPVTLSPITNSLSGDVNLNNTGSYFDGPSLAQGTSGTWKVEGTVTVIAGAAANHFDAKLWDGTTVISSARTFVAAGAGYGTISLSGYLASPAGNLRISVKDITATDGKMIFNVTGNSKDCTITATRIA